MNKVVVEESMKFNHKSLNTFLDVESEGGITPRQIKLMSGESLQKVISDLKLPVGTVSASFMFVIVRHNSPVDPYYYDDRCYILESIRDASGNDIERSRI